MDKTELQEVRRWARRAFQQGSVGFETISTTVQPVAGGSYELLLMTHNRRMNKIGMVTSTFTADQWRTDPANIVHQTWTHLIARVLADGLGIKME